MPEQIGMPAPFLLVVVKYLASMNLSKMFAVAHGVSIEFSMRGKSGHGNGSLFVTWQCQRARMRRMPGLRTCFLSSQDPSSPWDDVTLIQVNPSVNPRNALIDTPQSVPV